LIVCKNEIYVSFFSLFGKFFLVIPPTPAPTPQPSPPQPTPTAAGMLNI